MNKSKLLLILFQISVITTSLLVSYSEKYFYGGKLSEFTSIIIFTIIMIIMIKSVIFNIMIFLFFHLDLKRFIQPLKDGRKIDASDYNLSGAAIMSIFIIEKINSSIQIDFIYILILVIFIYPLLVWLIEKTPPQLE